MNFEELRDKEVCVICAAYIYSGTLIRYDHSGVELGAPSIVYETGPWNAAAWKDAQRLPMQRLHIERGAIESIGPVERGAAKGGKRG